MKDIIISICSKKDLELLSEISFNGTLHIGAPNIQGENALELEDIMPLLLDARSLGFNDIVVDLPLINDMSLEMAVSRISYLINSGATLVCIEYLPNRADLWQALDSYSDRIVIQFGYVAQSINMKNPTVLESLDKGFVQKSPKALGYLTNGVMNLTELGYDKFLFEAVSNVIFPKLLSLVDNDSFFVGSVGIKVAPQNEAKINAVALVLEDILYSKEMKSIPPRPPGMTDESVVKRIIQHVNGGFYQELFHKEKAFYEYSSDDFVATSV